MRTLFLQAVDVWMFRDGKPFDAGGGYRAESMFPPFPSTIQGALRSHELVVTGVNVKDQDAIETHVGTRDDLRGFKVRGTFVAECKDRKMEVYLPVPANAAPNKDKGWVCLKPDLPRSGVQSSSQLPQLLWPEETEAVKHHGFGDWLSLTEWGDFWNGNAVKGKATHDLFIREPRFGIELNSKKRTVEEGQLYEAEFIRPEKNVGLLVEAEGFTLAGWKDGFLRLGGEAHAATYETVDNLSWPILPNPLPKRFAVCFITPTFFKGGWQPENGDWSRFFDGAVTLVSAAFGRYQSLGGFDWAKFRRSRKDAEAHKPAKRYLPAGAVYFFETNGATTLKTETLTDEGADIGLGRLLIQGV